ncbi:succinate-semialdehyde dehydrogenase [Klebsiella pneumoniae]|nr:succinate-semialdehyde dehydrogenase [Klebsiella pneumoniae]
MAYQTVNPANNQLIKTYPAHSDADVEAALQQADAPLPFCLGKRRY